MRIPSRPSCSVIHRSGRDVERLPPFRGKGSLRRPISSLEKRISFFLLPSPPFFSLFWLPSRWDSEVVEKSNHTYPPVKMIARILPPIFSPSFLLFNKSFSLVSFFFFFWCGFWDKISILARNIFYYDTLNYFKICYFLFFERYNSTILIKFNNISVKNKDLFL